VNYFLSRLKYVIQYSLFESVYFKKKVGLVWKKMIASMTMIDDILGVFGYI